MTKQMTIVVIGSLRVKVFKYFHRVNTVGIQNFIASLSVLMESNNLQLPIYMGKNSTY